MSEDGSDLRVEMNMTEPMTGKGINMVLTNKTERLGECTSPSF